MKTFLIITLSILLSASVVKAQNPVSEIPSFTFFQLNGGPFTDQQIQKGKLSMFSFFDVTCSHCQKTMQLLSNEYSNLSHLNLYLVTMDRGDAVSGFMKIFGKNLINKKNVIILQDVNRQFVEKFYPRKYPAVFLFDKNKKLLIYQDEESKISSLISKAKSYK